MCFSDGCIYAFVKHRRLASRGKDIEADVDATVAQAMNTLVFCLECLRPENEQKLSKNRAEGNHKFHQFSMFFFSEGVACEG